MSPSSPKVGLHRQLYIQVLAALLAGIAVGHFWPGVGTSMKPFADGFIKLVRMMIAPVVFCTIVVGVAGMKDTKEIGKTLLKSMALFYVLVTLALLTGLLLVELIGPGVGMNIDPARLDATLVSQY